MYAYLSNMITYFSNALRLNYSNKSNAAIKIWLEKNVLNLTNPFNVCIGLILPSLKSLRKHN